MVGHEAFALPGIEEVIDLTVRLGRRTNSGIRCAGASLNTSGFAPREAEALMAAESDRLGLAVADPIRGGARFEDLVDACLG